LDNFVYFYYTGVMGNTLNTGGDGATGLVGKDGVSVIQNAKPLDHGYM
jgi:hypothetical protein